MRKTKASPGSKGVLRAQQAPSTPRNRAERKTARPSRSARMEPMPKREPKS